MNNKQQKIIDKALKLKAGSMDIYQKANTILLNEILKELQEINNPID